MKIEDSFVGKGDVKITLRDKTTGKIVGGNEDHNLIVKTGRSTLIRLIAGEVTAHITKMAIGKGGTADLVENAFNPIPPVDGDTDLKSKVFTANINSTTVNTTETNPKVTFVTLFDCSDVDSLVNECALVFNDGTVMFSRYTFDTVSLKASSNLSLEISWTIEF